MFGSLGVSPSSGQALLLPFTVTFNLSEPFPAGDFLYLVLAYVPVNAADAVPTSLAPAGFPRLTDAAESPLAYLIVPLICTAQSPADCEQSVQTVVYLPQGVYQVVLHASANLTSTPDAIFAQGAVDVSPPAPTSSGTDQDAVCSILLYTNDTEADPLTGLSMLAVLVNALDRSDQLQAVATSSLAAMGCTSMADDSALFGDHLLSALQQTMVQINTITPYLAINAVNSVSASVLSMLDALRGSHVLASAEVLLALTLASELTYTLMQAGVGYQSGNNSALFIHNEAFRDLAAVYDALLTNASAQHCAVLGEAQGALPVLLTVAMTEHQESDTDVTFALTAYTAASSRVAAGTSLAMVTLDRTLSLDIPSSAFGALPPTSMVDVQRLIFSMDGSGWRSCYPESANAAVSNSVGNVTTAALLSAPLTLISVATIDGVEVGISDLSTPLQFVLSYNQSAVGSSTPACAFFNRTTSAWSMAGCSSSLVPAGVLCSCTHLTEFTVIGITDLPAVDGGDSRAISANLGSSADLLGLLIIYLVPLLVTVVLLIVLQATHVSALPWSRTVYASIAAVAVLRCVMVALLYFDNANQATSTFAQNHLAIVMTSLLVAPLIAELLLVVHLVYRYAVVRRKEDSSSIYRMLGVRRASGYAGSISLMPRRSSEAVGGGRRASLLHRLSVMAKPDTPVTNPPSVLVPAVFVAVSVVATVPALVVFLYFAVASNGAAQAILALVSVVMVAALVMVCTWTLFLYRSLPNHGNQMRQGQAIGWIPVVSFALQSLLFLAFAARESPSWYFTTANGGGVHVMLTLYALVEVATLTGLAAFWAWTISWWRPHGTDRGAPKTFVTRYDDDVEAAVPEKGAIDVVKVEMAADDHLDSHRAIVSRDAPEVVVDPAFLSADLSAMEKGKRGSIVQAKVSVPELIKMFEDPSTFPKSRATAADVKYDEGPTGTYTALTERQRSDRQLSTYRSVESGSSAVDAQGIATHAKAGLSTARPQLTPPQSSPTLSAVDGTAEPSQQPGLVAPMSTPTLDPSSGALLPREMLASPTSQPLGAATLLAVPPSPGVSDLFVLSSSPSTSAGEPPLTASPSTSPTSDANVVPSASPSTMETPEKRQEGLSLLSLLSPSSTSSWASAAFDLSARAPQSAVGQSPLPTEQKESATAADASSTAGVDTSRTDLETAEATAPTKAGPFGRSLSRHTSSASQMVPPAVDEGAHSPLTALSMLISASPTAAGRTLRSPDPTSPSEVPTVTFEASPVTSPIVPSLRLPRPSSADPPDEAMQITPAQTSLRGQVSRDSEDSDDDDPIVRSSRPVIPGLHLPTPQRVQRDGLRGDAEHQQEDDTQQEAEEEEKQPKDMAWSVSADTPTDSASGGGDIHRRPSQVYVIHPGKKQMTRDRQGSFVLSVPLSTTQATVSPPESARSRPIDVQPRKSRVTRGSITSTPSPYSASALVTAMPVSNPPSGGSGSARTGNVRIKRRITRAASVSPSPLAQSINGSPRAVPVMDLSLARPRSRKNSVAPAPAPPRVRGRSHSVYVPDHIMSARPAHGRHDSVLVIAGSESLQSVSSSAVHSPSWSSASSAVTSPVFVSAEAGKVHRSITSFAAHATDERKVGGVKKDNFMAED